MVQLQQAVVVMEVILYLVLLHLQVVVKVVMALLEDNQLLWVAVVDKVVVDQDTESLSQTQIIMEQVQQVILHQ